MRLTQRAALWLVRSVILAAIAYVLMVAALIPRQGQADGKGALVWPVALVVVTALAGAFFLKNRIQAVLAGSVLAMAVVIIPLEWYFGTASQRLRRAHERRALLPVLRTSEGDIYPLHAPWDFAFGRKWLTSRGAPLLPLGGLSNRLTGLCAVDGAELVFTSDEHGFRNPSGSHGAGDADLVLIGDSFAQGYCVEEARSVAGLLRSRYPRTVNLGATGAGPLWELGTLREYGAALRPAVVVWLFFEGNDLMSLDVEAGGLTGSYLAPGFSQGLRARQPEIDSALLARADSMARSLSQPSADRLRRLVLLKEIRARLQLNLRPPEGRATKPAGVASNLQSLTAVLQLARQEVDRWDGELLFVYLPDFQRHSRDPLRPSGKDTSVARDGRESVLAAARAAGMELLDMTPAFSALPDPLLLWDRGQDHYNKFGYRLVGDSILARLPRWLATDRTLAGAHPGIGRRPDEWIQMGGSRPWIRQTLIPQTTQARPAK